MDSEKIKTVLMGAVGGAVALAIVGFTWGGWVVASKARVMTADAVELAVVERLAPICVEQYNQDSEKAEKHTAMMKIDSWNRGDYVGKQGWATMPGAEDSESRVSRECAERLSKVTG